MTKNELELIKEEYRRLAEEISGTFTHRIQIIEFGLAFVGILIGYALKVIEDNSTVAAGVVLVFMIPAACFMILSLWLSEVRRTRRASWYMFGLERRVNNELKVRALRWEEDIRGKGFNPLAVFRFHYYTTAYFFVIVAVFATIYGMLQWQDMPSYIRVGWPLLYGIGITFIVSNILNRLRKYDFPDKSWPETLSNKPI
jgi:hypothetical protein